MIFFFRISALAFKKGQIKKIRALCTAKVEIFLEQREIAFLSPSKNLNLSTEIQIFANFDG
jgi:hypothetical protein